MQKVEFLPLVGINAHFTHRDAMTARGVTRAFHPMARGVPVTSLPVDGTGNAAVLCPIDANDQYGICGSAAGTTARMRRCWLDPAALQSPALQEIPWQSSWNPWTSI